MAKQIPLGPLVSGILKRMAICVTVLVATVFTFPYKLLVLGVAKFLRPDLEGIEDGMSALFGILPDGTLRYSNLMSVACVDGHVTLQEFRRLFECRVMQQKDKYGDQKFRKLKQYLVQFMGYPFLKDEASFSLEKHIETYDYQKDNIATFDQSALEKYTSALFSTPWKLNESWWRFRLVHNYNNQGQTLVIGHWHHATGDGFTAKRVLYSLFDDASDDCKGKNSLRPVLPSVGPLRVLAAVAKSWYEGARFKLEHEEYCRPLWHKSEYVEGSKKFHSTTTKAFTAEDIKTVQTKYGVGFQAVLLSAVSAALQKVLQKYGQPLPQQIISDYATLSTRQNNDVAVTNEFNYGYVSTPLVSNSMRERLTGTDESFRNHKSCNIPIGTMPFLYLTCKLPSKFTSVLNDLIFPSHIVFSSFPYFGKLTYQGCPVTDLFSLFEGEHPYSDLLVLVTGCPNQVRFGLAFSTSVNSLPPNVVYEISEAIEVEMENLITECKV